MYHYIGKPEDPDDRPYYISTKEFEKQMEFLKKRGYQTIGLIDLVKHLYKGNAVQRRSVVITFDDGHISFAQEAFPIISRCGFTATMFLITSRIGTRNRLDWPEIYYMQSCGFSFQSHSVTHPILTKIQLDEAKQEIAKSKNYIEDKLGQRVDFFAYRGGHFNDNIKRLVKSSGYVAAVCSKYGYNTATTDPYELKRISIRNNDDILKFGAKLYGRNPKNRLYNLISHYLLR